MLMLHGSFVCFCKLISDEMCMPQLAQGSKGNAFTGGDFAAAPCLLPSCWRRPTRADRYKWLAEQKKNKKNVVFIMS